VDPDQWLLAYSEAIIGLNKKLNMLDDAKKIVAKRHSHMDDFSAASNRCLPTKTRESGILPRYPNILKRLATQPSSKR
jgi:hypothetical protein